MHFIYFFVQLFRTKVFLLRTLLLASVMQITSNIFHITVDTQLMSAITYIILFYSKIAMKEGIKSLKI